ncbi:unnamed protein product [Vitrella brassicaformis CCMP3155]|uniref:Exostosin GT47 domain-containing protein n=1 Tax=Vitrella brassicaformis (strain CCMP3155) TaxID=1169540 RepID=A0A0G4FFC7_VITBC|nr:unnamed protein product [Vitrella brassicaformis CCMP3155]|eukprot:CEM11861.1 unnamed protein product [Vitrella brassicaformis CCMP3155]
MLRHTVKKPSKRQTDHPRCSDKLSSFVVSFQVVGTLLSITSPLSATSQDAPAGTVPNIQHRSHHLSQLWPYRQQKRRPFHYGEYFSKYLCDKCECLLRSSRAETILEDFIDRTTHYGTSLADPEYVLALCAVKEVIDDMRESFRVYQYPIPTNAELDAVQRRVHNESAIIRLKLPPMLSGKVMVKKGEESKEACACCEWIAVLLYLCTWCQRADTNSAYGVESYAEMQRSVYATKRPEEADAFFLPIFTSQWSKSAQKARKRMKGTQAASQVHGLKGRHYRGLDCVYNGRHACRLDIDQIPLFQRFAATLLENANFALSLPLQSNPKDDLPPKVARWVKYTDGNSIASFIFSFPNASNLSFASHGPFLAAFEQFLACDRAQAVQRVPLTLSRQDSAVRTKMAKLVGKASRGLQLGHRPIFAFFAGRAGRKGGGRGNLRSAVFASFEPNASDEPSAAKRKNATRIVSGRVSRARYSQYNRESTFCLCPAGSRVFSPRLMQSSVVLMHPRGHR